jgi:hypothetical protein
MNQTDSDYEAGRTNLRTLAEWYAIHHGDRNEATTRLQLVDRLFFDCLGWSRDECVELEHELKEQYADYLFNTPYNALILEAKREGQDFEIPAGKSRLTYSIKGLMADYPPLREAFKQVAGYCYERGIPYGAVCNGHQVVAFVAVRTDGVPPLTGQAFVFPSLQFMLEHFIDLWQVLSKPGVQANKLHHHLVAKISPDLPPKLSASLMNYPGVKNRNIFQADMKILSELLIEDVSRLPDLEKTFLQDCYCQSNALSQYSQLSRDILSARYSALFDGSTSAPSLSPASTQKGITSDLLAESLSRRPIILIGDVGVGKTMFQRNLIARDEEGIFKNAISLYVNFGEQAILSLTLKTFLIVELERQLLDHQAIDINDNSFIRGVYNLDLKRFEKGLYGPLAQSNPGLFAEKQLNFLIEKIADRSEHLRKSLDHISRARRKQIVVFLDNADQRDYDVQEEVFLISQELAAQWPVAVFMPIRPETFHRSKNKDALSGYHAKAFTIAPPRIDLVVDARLKFALKYTSGELPVLSASPHISKAKREALDHIIRAFLFSFHKNSELAELLDNISNGNVRLVLDLVQQYFGSGHVDTERIYNAYRTNKFYFVSLHEFIRAIMFGDNAFFEPNRSPFVNIFDITTPDPKEHFLLPLLIGSINSLKSTSLSEGFVDTNNVVAKLQSVGFTPNQIEHAIVRACQKRLIEATARRIPEIGTVMPPMLRSTSVGLYHVNKLCTLFTYIDAISIDMMILESDVRRKICLVSELRDRLNLVRRIISYLTRCWNAVPNHQGGFDWTEVAQKLEADMVKVEENSRARGE